MADPRSHVSNILIAVSGGIDSMALLHMCRYKWPQKDTYVVAHVDHGIRADGQIDSRLVEATVQNYGFSYETIQLGLGSEASEAVAREARYTWLETIRQKYSANAIMTAHHQDDVLETICINLIRGTGWRGLASLVSSEQLKRPLLDTSKALLVEYALKHGLQWRDDHTNDDMRLLRNNVRASIVRTLDADQRKELINLCTSQVKLRRTIESESASLGRLVAQDDGLSRHWLLMLGPEAAYEVVVSWLGQTMMTGHWHQLHRVIATAQPGTNLQLAGGLTFGFTKTKLVVYH